MRIVAQSWTYVFVFRCTEPGRGGVCVERVLGIVNDGCVLEGLVLEGEVGSGLVEEWEPSVEGG